MSKRRIIKDYEGHDATMPDLAQRITRWLTSRCKKIDPDAIVVCGAGGLLVAPVVAAALWKPIILVRKEGDVSRSSPYKVEGPCDNEIKTYVIIDDVWHYGNTVQHMMASMEKHRPSAECKAILLYCQPENFDTPPDEQGVKIIVRNR